MTCNGIVKTNYIYYVLHLHIPVCLIKLLLNNINTKYITEPPVFIRVVR